jgi:hypothetical protein
MHGRIFLLIYLTAIAMLGWIWLLINAIRWLLAT